MNRKQIHMEKAVALVMLAYAIGLLVGESLRDYLYGPAQPAQKQPASGQPQPATRTNSKRHLYSGLFIFLKRKPRLPPKDADPDPRSRIQSFLPYHPRACPNLCLNFSKSCNACICRLGHALGNRPFVGHACSVTLYNDIGRHAESVTYRLPRRTNAPSRNPSLRSVRPLR